MNACAVTTSFEDPALCWAFPAIGWLLPPPSSLFLTRRRHCSLQPPQWWVCVLLSWVQIPAHSFSSGRTSPLYGSSTRSVSPLGISPSWFETLTEALYTHSAFPTMLDAAKAWGYLADVYLLSDHHPVLNPSSPPILSVVQKGLFFPTPPLVCPVCLFACVHGLCR